MSFFLSENPVTYKMAWSYRTRRTFTRARLGDPFVDVVWLVLAITVAVGVLGVLLRRPYPLS